MRRNPALTLRTPSRLSTARGPAMNRAVVGDYFQDVAKYTEGLQPISIWNMDEIDNFSRCAKGFYTKDSRPGPLKQLGTRDTCYFEASEQPYAGNN
ncbi:hypothetical protein LSH36_817g00003 [Paralvinella palmiformis]|uniref:Uncharacterized protein n=1 Tax=Paralvinella palmiformis TaxID=53620 RepID=A0AAD9J0E3_9ANNE|nr:hypothetical protein LSH36_817g00003 [Paralvinella palmiformis]